MHLHPAYPDALVFKASCVAHGSEAALHEVREGIYWCPECGREYVLAVKVSADCRHGGFSAKGGLP